MYLQIAKESYYCLGFCLHGELTPNASRLDEELEQKKKRKMKYIFTGAIHTATNL